jgi:hypothetical protein
VHRFLSLIVIHKQTRKGRSFLFDYIDFFDIMLSSFKIINFILTVLFDMTFVGLMLLHELFEFYFISQFMTFEIVYVASFEDIVLAFVIQYAKRRNEVYYELLEFRMAGIKTNFRLIIFFRF